MVTTQPKYSAPFIVNTQHVWTKCIWKIQTVYTSWCGETAQLQQEQPKFLRQNIVWSSKPLRCLGQHPKRLTGFFLTWFNMKNYVPTTSICVQSYKFCITCYTIISHCRTRVQCHSYKCQCLEFTHLQNNEKFNCF